MRILSLASVLGVSAAAVALPAWATGMPRHTPRVAQTHVLGAPRVLGRFSPTLLDPRTGLLRNNTTAVCRGIGKPHAGAYATLTCVVSSGHIRVSVRYLAEQRNGFELHRIRVWRSA
jgi:hypothetical protein